MAKLGRRFCRLVIYANRHTFPYVCASLFLNFSCDFWNYSSKEGSLEHGKTWLGRRFCCLVIHACPICASKWLRRCFFHLFCEFWVSSWENTLRTWQTVFQKVFLLFGDLSKSSRLPCMCVKIIPKGICFFSDVIRTWQPMVWKAFLLFCDLCLMSIFTSFHVFKWLRWYCDSRSDRSMHDPSHVPWFILLAMIFGPIDLRGCIACATRPKQCAYGVQLSLLCVVSPIVPKLVAEPDQIGKCPASGRGDDRKVK